MYIFHFVCYAIICVPRGPMQYVFHTLMPRYHMFVLKVPLNQPICSYVTCAVL